MERQLRAAFDTLTKDALIDLLGDALDQIEGEGQWRVADAVEFAAPRLRVRGEREPKIWKALRPKPRPPIDFSEPGPEGLKKLLRF